MPKSYTQAIRSNHTLQTIRPSNALNHIRKPYAKTICPSQTPKPYAQIIHPTHTPKPYAQIITTVVLLSYCIQSSHSEMVRLKKECIYNNQSSIKGNYAKLDGTQRFELVV